MPLKAYIFINLSTRQVKESLFKIKATKGVGIAEAVTGPYDIVATIEAENIDEIGKLVTEEILSIEGIERTLTSIVLQL
jgi:DNA-binding Lrp family transcriptional regulator